MADFSLPRSPRRWLKQNPFLWQRWLIVALVLLLSGGIAYVASPGRVRIALMLVTGLIAGIAIIQLLQRWPALGLVLLIPANMVAPSVINIGGTSSSPNPTVLLIALLLGLWLYDMLEQRRGIHLHDSRPIRPLLLLVVVATVALIVGQLRWFNVQSAPLSAQIGGLSVFFFSAGAFLLAGHQIRDLRWLKWLVWTFVAFSAVFLVFRVVPSLFRYTGVLFQWGGVSSQFWTWLVAITFSQALFNEKLDGRRRIALWIVFGVAMYASFILRNEWKSGWIPPMIAIAVIVGLRSWQLGVVIALLGLIVAPEIVNQLVASDEYSFSTRLDAWLIMAEIIKVNPILGLGPANYYFYTPLFSIRGYNVEFNSHNQYVDMVAQTGVIGLAVLLWFFTEVGALGWKLRERVPDGFARAYVYGALGGLVATVASGMLGDWILPFVYNVGIVGMRSSILGWLFLGALVALEQMYGETPPHGRTAKGK